MSHVWRSTRHVTQPRIACVTNAVFLGLPPHAQAALDTVLVLFIVACSGALLFGMNVALAELSEWWYHLE